MLIALLCESEMKLADETVEIILDKVNYFIHQKYFGFYMSLLSELISFLLALHQFRINHLFICLGWDPALPCSSEIVKNIYDFLI
jgi:hypothetical protein